MAYVSRDWIALEKGLVLFGLLGDVEHASRVALQDPNRRVARGGVQPGDLKRTPRHTASKLTIVSKFYHIVWKKCDNFRVRYK